MLLSELSKTAARTIEDLAGMQALIFPVPETEEDLDEKSDFSVANKIIAYVESDPTEMGKAVYASVQEHLQRLKQGIYDELERAAKRSGQGVWQVQSLIHKETADKQIAELIECLWVAVEFANGQDDYARKRDKLEQWLDARKNTRDFLPVSYGSNWRKSSISGQLESVVRPSFYTARGDKSDVEKKALDLYAIFRAGPYEYLSGVDLLKRRGKFPGKEGRQDSFLSTSHVAAISYLERLERLDESQKRAAREAWGTYIATITKVLPGASSQRDPDEALLSVLERIPADYMRSSVIGRHDGALLFETRLREDFPNPKDFQRISDALEKFFTAVETPVVRPHPYYAILRADGDGMGKLIDEQAKIGSSFEGHQEVSKRLTTFAREVEDIVKKDHEGTLLYSGGDDVLAFLPLHTVLQCARALSRAFKKELYFEDGQEKREQPTLSVGIAVVHHLSLLLDALQQSSQAERRAKSLPGKDALAITLYRRSGEEYSVRGKLEELDNYLAWLTPYFMSIPDQPERPWQRISLPRGTAYELRDTALRLTPFFDAPSSAKSQQGDAELENMDMQEPLKQDMLRILQRKLRASAQASDAGKEVKRAIQLLLCVFKKRLAVPWSEEDEKLLADERSEETRKIREFLAAIKQVEVAEFINELILVHELADALELTREKRTELQKEFVNERLDYRSARSAHLS